MHITLLGSLLTPPDYIYGPIFFILLLMVFTAMLRKYHDDYTRRVFMKAFYFKMACTLLFTLIVSFYYGGGDTEMYFHCAQDLRKAVADDGNSFWEIMQTKLISSDSKFANYFLYDGSRYPTYEAMHSASNFWVPRLGLPIGLLCDMSYLVMSMVFSFFALGGSIRLYKFFLHYFPNYKREIALGTLFIPSLCFWSSGFLKDPLCYGSVGFLVYGLFNIFIRRRKIVSSLIWVLISVILLFDIKVYILLGLLPGVVLWLFTEINKAVENKTLRRILAVITFGGGVAIAFVLINYLSSDESVQMYRLDTFVETSQYNRDIYKSFSKTEQGAYFTIETQNPVLIVLYGMVATLFRPFPWEVSSGIVLLSVLESFFFLWLTVVLMYKRGVFTFFRNAIKHPVFILCLVFSLIFAAAVGSTATNFGSISRYKIPCLPFYLIMVLIMYHQAGLVYPNWLRKLLGYPPPPRNLKRRI